MAIFFVLMVCLTITGQINAQENAATGLHSALAKDAEGDIIKKIDSEKSGNQQMKFQEGEDGTPKTGESLKFSGGEKSAGDSKAGDVKVKPKETTKTVRELKLDEKMDEAEKAPKHITAKPKENLGITKPKGKENEGLEMDDTKKKDNKEQKPLETGKFKQLSFHKQGPPQKPIQIQRFGAANLHQRTKGKKLVPTNKYHKAMPPRKRPNMHPPMMKSQSKPAAGKRNNLKRNQNLPGGGKVVFAKLPDSLLMKQVPKLPVHEGKLKTAGNQQKRKGQQLVRNQNHKKPVKNNRNNQMNIKKAWKVVKG